MQAITIETATPLSARGLYHALAEFDPQLSTDDKGRCFVSVQVGSDQQVVEVIDAIEAFVDSYNRGLDSRPRRTSPACPPSPTRSGYKGLRPNPPLRSRSQ
jgi:hypothetical protein